MITKKQLIDVIKQLNKYTSHKKGCGIVYVPGESKEDDYGILMTYGSGFAITNKCSCGLDEMLKDIEPLMSAIDHQS